MAFSAGISWQIQNGGNTANGGGFRGGSLLSAPAAPGLATATTGGTVAAGTYKVVVTYSDANGETTHSAEASIVTTGATSTITITSPADPSSTAATWSVYVGTVAGGPWFVMATAQVIGTNLVRTTTPPTSGTGPPGTDWSQANGTHATLTTLSTVHTTTTQINVSPTNYAVSVEDVGNVFNNTGGTATVQRLEILQVDLVNSRWLCDKAAGTSAQTMTGGMGGAFALPSNFGGTAIAGNRVFLKYNATAYDSLIGNFNVGGTLFIGYDTTRSISNTDANRPTLNAQANSDSVVSHTNAAGTIVRNIIVSANGKTSVNGFSSNTNGVLYQRCLASGCANGWGGFNNILWCEDCQADTPSTAGFSTGTGTNYRFQRCTATSPSGTANGFLLAAANGTLSRCLVYNSGGDNFRMTAGAMVIFDDCTAHTNSGSAKAGFNLGASSSLAAILSNCVAYGITGGNGFITTANNPLNHLYNCAGGGNTTNVNGIPAGQVEGFITLGADPVVSAAGLNFAPNTTANGGALLRAAGLPGATAATQLPGLSTLSYPDVGAVQHADPAAGGGGNIISGGVIAG